MLVNLKALGLNTSPNQLDAGDGAMVEASNVIIRRDNIIEPRRGFRLYGNSFGTSTDLAKQLMEYKDRILRHYDTKIQFDDGEGNFSTFSGDYSETVEGLRIKSIQANRNFYFTTSEGIQKISAKLASQFSTSPGYITLAGGLKALDISARLKVDLGNQSGFLPQDSAVAYRQVWAKKDANENLILGTPSQRAEVYNPLSPLIVRDFMRILGALDDITDNTTSANINDNDYVESLELPITASPQEIQANLISLATKLDQDILYGTDAAGPLQIASASISGGVCTITFSSGDPTQYLFSGSRIYLSGFVVTGTGDINGSQLVSSVTSSTITFLTQATGTIAVTNTKLESGEFRYISQNVDVNGTPINLNTLVINTPATNDDLLALQGDLEQTLFKLEELPDTVISSSNKTNYLDPISITTTSTVVVRFTLPSGITADDFYIVYRSAIAQATGTTALSDLSPGDELQEIYEAYPTSQEITQGYVEFEDVTPDAFRGANLYTNASTGEGILQANDVPPWAQDINTYKGYSFFANTRTRHRELASLLGVSSMIEEYDSGITPTLTISSGSISHTYTFVTGKVETFDLTVPAKSSIPASGYFDVDSGNDIYKYRFWYDTTGSDPAPSDDGRILVKILVTTDTTDLEVADKTRDCFNLYPQDFQSSTDGMTPVVSVANIAEGYTIDPILGPGMAAAGFAVVVTQQGQGEDLSNQQVLLSSSASPAVAVDETAKSLVRVINATSGEIVNAFYLSSGSDVPGKFLLEKKDLDADPFYLLANNSATGSSFNPDFSPSHLITSVAIGNPSVITSSDNHNLVNGKQIIIGNTDSTPIVDGIYTVTVLSPTTFSIPVDVTIAGTQGAFSLLSDAQESDNERNVNRVYYSKFQQPEAVPTVNYLDIGSSDKEILRIFPLRDSLFVFKQDGLYRISGETAPFAVALFDSSCILTAADSVDVCNNLVFGWTTQGISTVSEAGVQIVSRPIDNIVLEKSSSNYVNFPHLTWGVGYDSDNAYYAFTNKSINDQVATIAFRYNTLTNTWTTYDKTNTCGIILDIKDKLFLGAGDVNYIEEERKSFTRLDYTDRELSSELTDNALLTAVNPYLYKSSMKLASVLGLSVGDVVTQEQTLTVYEYNMLLKKLDIDQGVSDSDYFETLEAKPGDNMRLRIVALATKLDADPGIADNTFLSTISSKSGSIVSNSAENPTEITTSVNHGLFSGRKVAISTVSGSSPDINGNYIVTVNGLNTFTIPVNVVVPGTGGTFITLDSDFEDIQACYNKIIQKLNADANVQFSNYTEIDGTVLEEAIILSIDTVSKQINLNLALPFVVGPLVIYKAFKSRIKYAPITFGDPLAHKHIREATIMFENKAFTQAKAFFATDLLFQERYVSFNGDGNGIFGEITDFGTGNYFGGTSHAAPFRTYIPRDCMRCRYISVGFEHQIAREKYLIFGITLTGETTQSSRAWR